MDTEDIIGYEALYNSMMKCKKGVMWKDSTAFFVHNWMREIRKLERQLHDGTYQERSPKVSEVLQGDGTERTGDHEHSIPGQSVSAFLE